MQTKLHRTLPELLLKMYENSSEAIFFFDENNTVFYLNPAAENILEDQILDKIQDGRLSFCSACKGYTNEEEWMSCESCYLEDRTRKFTSFQVYLNTKEVGVVPYAASFQVIDESMNIKVLMLRDLTYQLTTQEALYQNKMIKRTIEAQEDERKRISRELHDSVAQELLSSLVELRVLKYLNAQPDVLEKVQQTEMALTRLLDQIRHLSVELRPASLDDLGLEAAFRSHFKWIEKNYGVVVCFTAELQGVRFNSELETVIYRICQESVLNALKYADVDEIHVRLFKSEAFLELLVEDEGNGFDVNQQGAKGTGLGLYGMKERAELVNGKISLTSEVGKGTRVHLQIPI